VEIGLRAAQRIAKRGRRRRPGSAGELPLSFGRESVLPSSFEPICAAFGLGELATELLRLGVARVVDPGRWTPPALVPPRSRLPRDAVAPGPWPSALAGTPP